MNLTAEIAARSTSPGGLKPFFVRSLLAALTGTAALGILALLAGEFGELEYRILGSTSLVGLYCMLCLACQTVLGTRFASVGAAGMVAASAAVVLGLAMIWLFDENTDGQTAWNWARAGICLGITAFATAHAALLLRVVPQPHGALAALRTGALVALSVVGLMIALALIETEITDGFGYWRLLGVFAILDVLATICLPVLARLEARRDR